VTNYGFHGTVPECRHKAQDIANLMKRRKRIETVIEPDTRPRGTAIAPPVGSYHMESGLADRQHYFSPAVSKLGKSVQEYDAGAFIGLEACLQHVHSYSVDIFDEPGADTRWENCGTVRYCFSILLSPRVFADILSIGECANSSVPD